MYNKIKRANTTYKINEMIANRWSPRSFEPYLIAQEEVLTLLEAASWAPSAMNEQPWRFIFAHRGEEAFDKILQTMAEANQIWAKNAPLLMLTLAKKTYTSNGAINRSAAYDLGQAVANLSVQATELGIGIHQIGGFSPQKAQTSFNVSDEYEVVTALVLGKFGNPDQLPEVLKQRELSPRSRKKTLEIAFHGIFSN